MRKTSPKIDDKAIQDVIATFAVEGITLSDSTLKYFNKRKDNKTNFSSEVAKLKRKYDTIIAR